MHAEEPRMVGFRRSWHGSVVLVLTYYALLEMLVVFHRPGFSGSQVLGQSRAGKHDREVGVL